jgi:sodium-dependent dicarboxylate transporter 2/3/5
MNRFRRPIRLHKLVFLAAALALIVIIMTHQPPGEMTVAGRNALAIFVLCLSLWATNLIPLPATSLLAITLIPLLGVMKPARAFSFFGNQAVFFLLGVFLLTATMIRTGLSKRVALIFLERFDRSPRFLIFGILVSCAFFALWMPVHAVSAMMFPIVLEVSSQLGLQPHRSRYGKALFLSLAWGTIIGGVGTFLGGARAPLAVGLLQEFNGQTITFLQWAKTAIPVVVLMVPLATVHLMLLFPPDIKEVRKARHFLRQELDHIGPMTAREKRMGLLILATIMAWILFGLRIGLAEISILAAILLFILKIVHWKEIEDYVNWSVIVMYGGAIAIGKALMETRALESLILGYLPFDQIPPFAILVILAVISILLTEGISNAAAVAVLIPLGFAIGNKYGLSPILIVFTVTIPAGLPFCLPMGSPSNAISYSAGHYSIREMVRAGIFMNLAAILVLMLIMHFYWPLIGLVY